MIIVALVKQPAQGVESVVNCEISDIRVPLGCFPQSSLKGLYIMLYLTEIGDQTYDLIEIQNMGYECSANCQLGVVPVDSRG